MNDEMFKMIEPLLWSALIRSMEEHTDTAKHGYWTDGQEFLCKREEQADALADFLEDLSFTEVNTGYYDPKEDERDGCVDEHTGQWYVGI